MTLLQQRAWRALDRSHGIPGYTVGIARATLARWLDGKRVRLSTVREFVDMLEYTISNRAARRRRR